ncbi:MAG TPA: hypothetical protein VF841_17285 [Anaeromyxobacter sp.]
MSSNDSSSSTDGDGAGDEQQEQERRERDVQALAAFAEEHAKPIAALVTFMVNASERGLGSMILVLRTLEVAMQRFATDVVRPEAEADFERAAQVAAAHLVLEWQRSAENLEFHDALTRATQKGGRA